MPQYAVFLHFPADRIADEPDPEALAAHTAHSEELRRKGVMVFGAPLADRTATTSIRGGVVTDGPFTETHEVVVGFYVIDVPSLDEALELARQNPINAQGGGVEVRPVQPIESSTGGVTA